MVQGMKLKDRSVTDSLDITMYDWRYFGAGMKIFERIRRLP
jgi:hypothetical protein